MVRALIGFLTITALAGTLMPAASCMGFGRPCCCDGSRDTAGDRTDTVTGSLQSAAGCTCSHQEMSNCAPDTKPATAPEGRAVPPTPATLLLTPGGNEPAAVTAGRTASLPPTSEPPPTPTLSALGCLRI